MTYSSHTDKYNENVSKNNPVGIDYLVRFERDKVDFVKMMPDKKLEKERLDWGFFGYTYLGHNQAWLNESLDQTPEFKYEVDVHECGHCNWEYRTRIVSKDRVKEEPRESIITRLRKEREDYDIMMAVSKNYNNLYHQDHKKSA